MRLFLSLLAAAAFVAIAPALAAAEMTEEDCVRSLRTRTVLSMGCALHVLVPAADDDNDGGAQQQPKWVLPTFCVSEPKNWLPQLTPPKTVAPGAFHSAGDDVAEEASVADPCFDIDPHDGNGYVEVPVMLANLTLLRRHPELGAANARYVGMESSVSIATRHQHQPSTQLHFQPKDFIHDAADSFGMLRLGCLSANCYVLARMIRDSRWEPFEPLLATVTVRLPCGATHRVTQPIAVQGAAFRRTEPSTSPTSLGVRHSPRCRNLTAEAAFDVPVSPGSGSGVCRLRLHRQQRIGTGGSGGVIRYHAEPLLCYVGGASVKIDHNRQQRYLRLPLLLRSDAVLKAASADFLLAEAASAAGPGVVVAFMRLVEMKLRVKRLGDAAVEWEMQLAADGDVLVLRLLCSDKSVCDKWRSTLEADPLALFSHIEWLPVAELRASGASEVDDGGGGGGCLFVASSARLSVPPKLPTLAAGASSGSNRCARQRFVRLDDGRQFLVVQWRKPGSAGFGVSWRKYDDGFVDGESFWIGLWSIHMLTGNNGGTLRIEMRLWSPGPEKLLFVEYSRMRVVGDWFQLHYDRLTESNLGPLDPLARSNGKPFSTREWVHNDVGSLDSEARDRMIRRYGNAGWWWFDATGQQADFNPNGIMLPAGSNGSLPAADWLRIAGLNVSASLSGGGVNDSTRGWRPLKEVRIMVEV